MVGGDGKGGASSRCPRYNGSTGPDGRYWSPKAAKKSNEPDRKGDWKKMEANLTPMQPKKVDEKWLATDVADAINKGAMIPDGAIKFTEGTALGRQLATGAAEATEDFARVMELSKPLTKGLTIINVAATGVAVTNDIYNGNYTRGATRAGVAIGIGIVTGLCLPCGLVLGITEAVYGDYLYEKIH